MINVGVHMRRRDPLSVRAARLRALESLVLGQSSISAIHLPPGAAQALADLIGMAIETEGSPMSGFDDNGPVCPVPNSAEVLLPSGMSLRDWFAGQALAGILSDASWQDSPSYPWPDIAEDAYSFADAMLDARNKRENL